MPELPEVETIRSGLDRLLLNKKIKAFIINDSKLSLDLKRLKELEGDYLAEIGRLGKMLVFSFRRSKRKLLIHLKMTGQLIVRRDQARKRVLLAGGHSDQAGSDLEQNLKHIRFQVLLAGAYRLILNDARRFAYVKLLEAEDFPSEQERFGLEPLSGDFNWKNFSSLCSNHSAKNIKAFLLDQSLIAGIGNIYADETLSAAGISPLRKVADLSRAEQKNIFHHSRRLLRLAVKKRGTTFSNYLDAEGRSGGFLKLLKVYGRQGQECFKCQGTIRKIRLVGRGTHYCPKCQN